MDLSPYVEEVRRQLAVAAEGGGEDARELAERLGASLDSALRLTLLEVLSVAVAEITSELAPGSVEVRLRGREPEFVVTPPPVDAAVDAPPAEPLPRTGEDEPMTRINLRLPDRLKARIEQAADRDGLSINAWLVRAAASAVERGASHPNTQAHRSEQRYRGWAR